MLVKVAEWCSQKALFTALSNVNNLLPPWIERNPESLRDSLDKVLCKHVSRVWLLSLRSLARMETGVKLSTRIYYLREHLLT